MAKGKLNLTGLDDLAGALASEQGSVPIVSDTIRLDKIIPDPNQPRKRFNQTKLMELCESIKAHGVLEPIIVRPMNAEGMHPIVFGERRWRAATMANLAEIPAKVKDTTAISEEEVRLVQLVENIQRDDLDALEVATTIKGLLDDGMKKAAIATKLGQSASYVSEHLALVEGPEFVRELAARNAAGLRTLYDLVKAHKEFPSEVEAYAATTEEITRAGVADLVTRLKAPALSMSGAATGQGPSSPTEQGANQASEVGNEGSTDDNSADGGKPNDKITEPSPATGSKNQGDPNIASLERELSEKLGTKVTISHGKNGGSMNIRYFTVEELEGILGRFR